MKCILVGQQQPTGVTSFKNRTGSVVPQTGDYTADMVGAVPTTRKINNKILNSDISLSANDVNALPISGGTLSGDLTGQQITGTWLKSTANNHSSSTTTKICIQDNEGWIYYRTPSEIFNDIGVSNAIQSAIGNAIAANY